MLPVTSKNISLFGNGLELLIQLATYCLPYRADLKDVYHFLPMLLL